MHFLIVGKDVSNDWPGEFEWICEAKNKEEAINKLEKHEKLISIREISLDERIEREEKEALKRIKSEYISELTKDMTIREVANYQKEIKDNKEIYYLALKKFNAKRRFTQLIKRQEGFAGLSMMEYDIIINQMIDAKSEEELNKVLSGINKEVE